MSIVYGIMKLIASGSMTTRNSPTGEELMILPSMPTSAEAAVSFTSFVR